MNNCIVCDFTITAGDSFRKINGKYICGCCLISLVGQVVSEVYERGEIIGEGQQGNT